MLTRIRNKDTTIIIESIVRYDKILINSESMDKLKIIMAVIRIRISTTNELVFNDLIFKNQKIGNN